MTNILPIEQKEKINQSNIFKLIEEISGNQEKAEELKQKYNEYLSGNKLNEEEFEESFSNIIKIFFQTGDIENRYSNITKFLVNHYRDVVKSIQIDEQYFGDNDYILSKLQSSNKSSGGFDTKETFKKIDNIFLEKGSQIIDKNEFLEIISTDLFTQEEQEILSCFVGKIGKSELNIGMIKGGLKSAIKKRNKSEQSPRKKEFIELIKNLRGNNFSFSGDEIFLARYFINSPEREKDEVIELLGSKNIIKKKLIQEMLKKGDDTEFQYILREFRKNVLLENIDEKTINELFQFSLDLASGKINISDLYLRVGIGGTENDFPMRFFSYLIYILEVGKEFKNSFGKSPKVELFTGEEGAIACNGMDENKVRLQTQKMFQLSDNFAKKFYEEVSFTTVKDPVWEEGSRILNTIDYLVEILEKERLNGDEELEKIIKQLVTRSKNHGNNGGEKNALRYGVFHLICFQDIPSLTKYIYRDKVNKKHIFTIGGKAEKEFTYIRFLLEKKFNAQNFNEFLKSKNALEFLEGDNQKLVNSGNITTNIGAVPPYYKANESDILIGDNIPEKISEILKDLSKKQDANTKSILQGLGIMVSTFKNPNLLINYLTKL